MVLEQHRNEAKRSCSPPSSSPLTLEFVALVVLKRVLKTVNVYNAVYMVPSI